MRRVLQVLPSERLKGGGVQHSVTPERPAQKRKKNGTEKIKTLSGNKQSGRTNGKSLQSDQNQNCSSPRKGVYKCRTQKEERDEPEPIVGDS